MGIEELKDKVGTEWQSRVYEIERGMIQRFAQAIADPNPLWQDEEYARQTRHGGIIAPPTFIATLGLEQLQPLLTATAAGAILHGSTELEYYHPVRVGDVITVTTKIAGFRQRHGKMGTMTFVTFDITYENQRGELAGRCRQMLVSY